MKRIPFLYLILSCFAATPAFAVPANPKAIEAVQPDGTHLQIHLKGDEFQNWSELTPTGHTIIKNPETGYWEYANLKADGSLDTTGIKVGPKGQNTPDFLPKGLKPKRNEEHEQHMQEKINNKYLERRAGSGISAEPSSPVEAVTPAPVLGPRTVLVVLVNFSDRTLTSTASNWYNTIFSTASDAKSMVNYYRDNSFGTIAVSPAAHNQAGNPPGIVTVTVPDPHPNSGGNITYSVETAILNHALAQAASYVDFSSFDTNGNGTLEQSELSVYFIYAGYEASGSAKKPSIWAHAWGGSITAGSRRVTDWALNGELNDYDAQHPVGVLVHELGHALFDLPDLYDTSYTNSGLGSFSLMSFGSWGADIGETEGTTPTVLDAWSREYLGWANHTLPANGPVIINSALSSSTSSYKTANPQISNSEYFLIENRQPVGWDRGLRLLLDGSWSGGLLILHIDNNIATNRYVSGSHQKVVPVQASTTLCDMLAAGSFCEGSATTLFYLGNNSGWTPTSTPNSNYYNGSPTNFSLIGISAPNDTMTANYSFEPDTMAPVVTDFTIPATSTSLIVPVTAFTATDNNGVTGYMITENDTAPAATAVTWSASPPARHIFSAVGVRTAYAWAKDASDNVSINRSATVTITDGTLPVITAFTLPATATSLTVPITRFIATDNIAVTGYMVTESPTAPLAHASEWSAAPPDSFTFSGFGTKTAYAWARDGAGNVSLGRNATVTIADTIAPSVRVFTMPAMADSLTVSVNAFTATDNIAVTGYMITENFYAPTAGAPGWSGTPPAGFTFSGSGTRTAYAWARDAAGNISMNLNAQVVIDTTPPVTTSSLAGGFYPSAQNITLNANEPAVIYFTTDGSTPTTSSPVYNLLIHITSTTTLKFFAKDTAGNSGALKTEVYYIGPDGSLDGKGVSITSALKALRIAMKIIEPTASDMAHGDVAPLINGKPQPDGVIDLQDVLVILRKVAGLVTW